MPREYEAMRDSLVRKGMSLKRAKTVAAKTWNARHPGDTNPWLHEKKTSGDSRFLSKEKK
jgi:hypothetical protein